MQIVSSKGGIYLGGCRYCNNPIDSCQKLPRRCDVEITLVELVNQFDYYKGCARLNV